MLSLVPIQMSDTDAMTAVTTRVQRVFVRRFRDAVDDLRVAYDVDQPLDQFHDDEILPRMTEALEPAIRAGLEAGAELGFDLMPVRIQERAVGVIADIGVQKVEKQLSDRLQRWMDNNTGFLIEGISRETRDAIQVVIERAVLEGLTTQATQDLIRPLIGLNRRFAIAVMNLKFSLLERGVSEERASKRANAHAKRLLNWRAENIARTETFRAVNAGRQMFWQEAKNEGLFTGQQVTRMWITAVDERVCPICRPMHRQTRKLGEQFLTGKTRALVDHPPAHPSCRCDVILLFDEEGN